MCGWYYCIVYCSINFAKRKNIGDFRTDLEFLENLYCGLFIQVSYNNKIFLE